MANIVAIYGNVGDTLLDAAAANGVELPHECGGNCACVTCRVSVLSGVELLTPPEEVEIDRLRDASDLTPETRLACQALFLANGAISFLVPNID